MRSWWVWGVECYIRMNRETRRLVRVKQRQYSEDPAITTDSSHHSLGESLDIPDIFPL